MSFRLNMRPTPRMSQPPTYIDTWRTHMFLFMTRVNPNKYGADASFFAASLHTQTGRKCFVLLSFSSVYVLCQLPVCLTWIPLPVVRLPLHTYRGRKCFVLLSFSRVYVLASCMFNMEPTSRSSPSPYTRREEGNVFVILSFSYVHMSASCMFENVRLLHTHGAETFLSELPIRYRFRLLRSNMEPIPRSSPSPSHIERKENTFLFLFYFA